MKILINIITMTSNHKIKTKTDKVLIETFIRILSKIFDENHMILNNHSNEIKIDQNSVFSSMNTIITKKIIFVLNTVFQIIQLKTVNLLLILIKHL